MHVGKFPRPHSRGRIEAPSGRSDRPSPRRFHALTAVAELNPHQGCGSLVHVSGFHGLTAVAELKLVDKRRALTNERGFHGLTAVAELKHPAHVRRQPFTQVSTASQPWPN